jgi:hypothetical protein
VLVAVHLVVLFGATGLGAESLITNGNFKKWTDGVPDGWEVEIGATNGAEQPKSEVKRIKGPALMLRGDASTMAWHVVGQKMPARTSGAYCLEFESRTKDIKREGRQFNNCYVGVMSFDDAGKRVAEKVEDVSADNAHWTKHRIVFAVPQNAESTKVMIFLSKTGILGVKNVTVTEVQAPSTSGAKPMAVTEVEEPPAPAVEPTVAAEAEPADLLANGNFRDWTDGRPDGWKVDIGATNGANQPKSEIIQMDGPALALRGNASTMAWHSLSQEPSLKKGRTYTLEFEARSENVRREGRQFNNCYVGVMSFDAAGNRVDMSIEDISRVPQWKKHRVHFRVPRNAESTQVMIFLSKSGTLMVRNLRLEEATPERPFRSPRR